MDGVAYIQCGAQGRFAQLGRVGKTEGIGEAVVVEHSREHWLSQCPGGCRESRLEDLNRAGDQLCPGVGVCDVFELVGVEEPLCLPECCRDAGNVHAATELLVETCSGHFLGGGWCRPGMCAGPADGDDKEGVEDVEEVVLAAGDVAVGVVEQADHVATAVAVQAAGHELVGDDGGVVRALHGGAVISPLRCSVAAMLGMAKLLIHD